MSGGEKKRGKHNRENNGGEGKREGMGLKKERRGNRRERGMNTTKLYESNTYKPKNEEPILANVMKLNGSFFLQ